MRRNSPNKLDKLQKTHKNTQSQTFTGDVIQEDINVRPTEALQQPPLSAPNPYQQQQSNSQQVLPVQANRPSTGQATHITQEGNTLIIDGPPPNAIIINSTPSQPAKPDPVWTREERIGCCCVSVDHQCYCCDALCMDSLCRCIQHSNLCCYCHDLDCMYCCIHSLCRTCCFEKGMLECLLECCKHMPLCMCIECLKNAGCVECICGLFQNCNICECLRNCNICQCLHNCNICEILQGCECQNTLNCIGELCCGIIGAICK